MTNTVLSPILLFFRKLSICLFIYLTLLCRWLEDAFSFFSFIFISWRLITLQYCSDFCHILTWISHGFTCVPHPNPPCLDFFLICRHLCLVHAQTSKPAESCFFSFPLLFFLSLHPSFLSPFISLPFLSPSLPSFPFLFFLMQHYDGER